MDDIFLPLGGADEVGASCYFVRVNNTNIILDCGVRHGCQDIYPKYNELLNGRIDNYEDIDAIIISHAHFDHIGSLFKIASLTKNVPIYATKATKELMRLQLITFELGIDKKESEKIQRMRKNQLSTIIERIQIKQVLRPFKVGDMDITLYPGGHMPGACMIGMESDTKTLLYTGDFSNITINQVNQLNLNGFHPDILLMNATYGYQRDKGMIRNKLFDVNKLEKEINEYLGNQKSVFIKSVSIPRHLDLMYALNTMNLVGKMYITDESELTRCALEELRFNVYVPNLQGERVLSMGTNNKEPHILIGRYSPSGYEVIDFDSFSLHAKFSELVNMVYLCSPKKVFTLHTVVDESVLNYMEEIKIQGRYQGELIQCYNVQEYQL